MYNNFYPSYQTPYLNGYNNQPMMYPNQAVQAPQQPQNNSNGIIWVQGEAGAKAYHVEPNSTVVLWDSENQVIYIKSADNSGMPTTRILDWVERTNKNVLEQCQETTAVNSADYVTRKEFDDIVNRLNVLSSRIGNNNKQKQNNNNQNNKGEQNNG